MTSNRYGLAVALLAIIAGNCSAYDLIKVRIKDKKTNAPIPDASVDLVFPALSGETVHMKYESGSSSYTASRWEKYLGQKAELKIVFSIEPFRGVDRPKYKFWPADEPTSFTVTSQCQQEYAALRYPDYYSSVALEHAEAEQKAHNIEKATDYFKDALEAVPSLSTYQKLNAAVERLVPSPSDASTKKIKDFVDDLKDAEWLGKERATLLLDFSLATATHPSKSTEVNAVAVDAAENVIAVQSTDWRAYDAKYQLLGKGGDPKAAAQVIKAFFEKNPQPADGTPIARFINDWLAYIEVAAPNNRFSGADTFRELVEQFQKHKLAVKNGIPLHRYEFAVKVLNPKRNPQHL